MSVVVRYIFISMIFCGINSCGSASLNLCVFKAASPWSYSCLPDSQWCSARIQVQVSHLGWSPWISCKECQTYWIVSKFVVMTYCKLNLCPLDKGDDWHDCKQGKSSKLFHAVGRNTKIKRLISYKIYFRQGAAAGCSSSREIKHANVLKAKNKSSNKLFSFHSWSVGIGIERPVPPKLL
jgi:hypothetical protein